MLFSSLLSLLKFLRYQLPAMVARISSAGLTLSMVTILFALPIISPGLTNFSKPKGLQRKEIGGGERLKGIVVYQGVGQDDHSLVAACA
jgi:hypothetical protein